MSIQPAHALNPKEQLDQLGSYLDAHYPLPDFTPPWAGGQGDPGPADRYTAHLPDRITHAAMLMLGSALDHTMPGVAYAQAVSAQPVPEIRAEVFTPANPTGHWALSLHSGGWWRGSAESLEMQWRPEVAAAAALSGTTIVDVDYPLAPQATLADIRSAVVRAHKYITQHSPLSITGWGYSSGGALAALCSSLFDALLLTFPDLGSVTRLPAEIRGDAVLPPATSWPRTLLQIATYDEVADRPNLGELAQLTVREYVSRHRISTPEVARTRIRDAAEFLAHRDLPSAALS